MVLNDLLKVLTLNSGAFPGSFGYILNVPPGHWWDEEVLMAL